MGSGRRSLFLPLFFGFTVLGIVLAVGFGGHESRVFQGDLGLLWERLGWPLVRLTLFISAGLFVGQVIESAGWVDRLTGLVRPMIRWGHLGEHLGAVFITAFFSGTAALSMLSTFHGEGKVDDRGVMVSVLLNTFPSYFLHLPTTFFIILPLTGMAGLLYLAITFGAALLRLLAVVVWGHFRLPEAVNPLETRAKTPRGGKEILMEVGTKFATRVRRIIFMVVPVYVLVFMLNEAGFFKMVRVWLAQSVGTTLIPVDAMSIVVISLAAEFTSGFAAAGAMMAAGTLTVFQTTVALIVGNLVATPIRALRHQMPVYMGVFDPKMGTKLIISTQIFRAASLAFVTTGFILGRALTQNF